MKKICVYLLILIMIVGLVNGCGKADDSKSTNVKENKVENKKENEETNSNKGEKDRLVFWTPFGGGDYEFMKQLVDEYNDTTAKYNVEIVSKDWATYYQGVNGALISQSGPDIFITHQSKLAELMETNQLSDIRKIINEVDWDQYNASQIKGVTFDGIQYAIPLDTHALVMFYNNDFLKRAGLTKTDMENIKDLDSFNEILSKLLMVIKEDEHVLDIADSGANTVQQFWTWYMLTAQAGGGYLEGDKPVLNSVQGIKALDILIEWNKKGYLKNGIDDAASYDIFKSGKAAINFTGVWATGNYESNTELDFGVMPIPALTGEQKTWGDSHTFGIPIHISDEKKQVAVAFADWINSHAVTWAKAGHVPAKTTITSSQEYLDLPYRSDYAKVVDQVVYYPLNAKLWSANDIAAKNINSAFIGNLSGEEALQNAEKEINSLMK